MFEIQSSHRSRLFSVLFEFFTQITDRLKVSCSSSFNADMRPCHMSQ
jgi:hypothetical protein